MRRILAITLCLFMTPVVVAATPKALTVESWPQLVGQHEAQPFLLVFWSVDCPPCHKELALLGQLLQEKGELPLTLVSTDRQLSHEDVLEVLERHGLAGVDNWQFADPVPARLRQAIDPRWYGELPRSYFFAADGERTAHSGVLSETRVHRFLDATTGVGD